MTSHGRLLGLGVGFAMLFPVLGCRPAPPPRGAYTIVGGDPHVRAEQPDVSQAEWTLSRERLARLRTEQPQRPYVERVRIAFGDPRTGRVYEARGAVAVSPNSAARLFLIGPGGTTVLDVWVTKDRFRFAIPSINLEKRGGTDPTDAPGMPIGLLRWWFLSPLGGKLVLARSSKSEAAFLLRDGDATVTVRTDGQRFVAIRREQGRIEGIEWAGRALVPRAGARGRYIDGYWGVRVDVVIEEVLDNEPDPAAFFDPDDQGTTL
jgi:hypothetical protein